ncbi:MAG TPA: hypothetical protein VKA34_06640, partial [Balneolales bacterium]|nr:hypothetical protein [Balneolales bacterium]
NYTGATTLGPYLYVMNADGSNMHPLKIFSGSSVKYLYGSDPVWSPDGTKIAFDICTNCERGGENYEIMTVDVAGEKYDSTQVHRLTNNLISDKDPIWSPDGQQIAFVSDRDSSNKNSTDIYLIDIKNDNIVRMTQTGNAGRQLWLSNGQDLIYWSNNNLYQLNINTKQSTQISFDILQGIGFRPLDINPKGTKILLITFDSGILNEQALQILDMSDKKLINIFNGLNIIGAHWFVPINN